MRQYGPFVFFFSSGKLYRRNYLLWQLTNIIYWCHGSTRVLSVAISAVSKDHKALYRGELCGGRWGAGSTPVFFSKQEW